MRTSTKALLSLLFVVAVLAASAFSAKAFPTIYADPCQNLGQAKSSVAINITTATTATIVAPTAGKSIYVCTMSGILTGTTTSTSVQLYSGTTTTNPCDTNQTALTGPYTETGAVGTLIDIAYGGTVFKAPSGAGICAKTLGTASGLMGVMTYVVQ